MHKYLYEENALSTRLKFDLKRKDNFGNFSGKVTSAIERGSNRKSAFFVRLNYPRLLAGINAKIDTEETRGRRNFRQFCRIQCRSMHFSDNVITPGIDSRTTRLLRKQYLSKQQRVTIDNRGPRRILCIMYLVGFQTWLMWRHKLIIGRFSQTSDSWQTWLMWRHVRLVSAEFNRRDA